MLPGIPRLPGVIPPVGVDVGAPRLPRGSAPVREQQRGIDDPVTRPPGETQRARPDEQTMPTVLEHGPRHSDGAFDAYDRPDRPVRLIVPLHHRGVVRRQPVFVERRADPGVKQRVALEHDHRGHRRVERGSARLQFRARGVDRPCTALSVLRFERTRYRARTAVDDHRPSRHSANAARLPTNALEQIG